MQVYRGMDIGTAKPSLEDQRRVRHYMIDLVDPLEEYSVAEFQRRGREIIDHEGHDTILIVGGSGLHFRALVDPHTFPPHDPQVRREMEALPDPVAALTGLDPRARAVVDLANRRRVVRALEVHSLTGLTPTMRAATAEADAVRRYQPLYPFNAVGVDPGPELGERIRLRAKAMEAAGLLQEVASLQGCLGRTASRAVGYRQLQEHLGGRCELPAAWAETQKATLALARRQRTFFRRDPRLRWVAWESVLERRIELVAEAWGLR